MEQFIQTKINVTQDYSLFKAHFFNRSLQKNNLLNIKESVSKNNLLHLNPIIVTESMEILDGNHRYHVAKELNLPIYFVKCDKFDLQMLIDLNFNLSKWGPFQFLELYCKMEKPEYLKYKKFQDHFKFDIYLGLPLTKTRGERVRLSEKFRKGEFVFSNEEQIYHWITCAMEFLTLGKEILLFKSHPHKDLAFFDGYEKLMKDPDFNQELLLSKLKKYGLQLLDSANMTGYVTQLTALLKRR